jgi:hypothetical protein
MQTILNYYNQHAQAESQGMSVDWQKVSNTMAKMLVPLIEAATPVTETPTPEG